MSPSPALLALRLGASVVPRMPRTWTLRAADLAGMAAYAFAGRRRRSLARNLAAVLGNHDSDLVALRAREAFRTQAANYVDLFHVPHLTFGQIGALVDLRGWGHLDAALAGGKGAILVSLHLGNVDLVIQAACARGVPVTIPIEALEPPELLELVTGLRTAHGLRLVPIDRGTVRELAATLRRGEIVGLAIDRDVHGTARPTPFLGRLAHLSHAPALLSLRTGAPIVPARVRRLPGGRFEAELGEPIRPRGTAAALMAAVARWLERAVRGAPGQWVMFEPVFNGEISSRRG